MQVWLVLNSQTSFQVLGSKVQAILHPESLGSDSELDCISQSGMVPWRLEQMEEICSLGFMRVQPITGRWHLQFRYHQLLTLKAGVPYFMQ